MLDRIIRTSIIGSSRATAAGTGLAGKVAIVTGVEGGWTAQ